MTDEALLSLTPYSREFYKDVEIRFVHDGDEHYAFFEFNGHLYCRHLYPNYDRNNALRAIYRTLDKLK